MKKIVVFILAAVMLLSLCACGNKDAADGTKPSDSAQTPTTGNTQAPTEGKTDATQPSGENNATQPTENNATTPAPTNPPAPTTCSHSWKAATCTAPKTCTKCSATEGNALSHSYEGGSCKNCGAEDNRVPFSDHIWQLDALNGSQLYRINLDCYKGTGMVNVSFWSESGQMGDPYQFDGKTYYEDGFGGDGDLNYIEDGDTVTINVSSHGGMKEGTLTLKRANATQYTVTAVTGTIISTNITSAIKAGSAFTVFILNIE